VNDQNVDDKHVSNFDFCS